MTERPSRAGLIGPFTGRQIALAAGVLLAAAAILVIVTAPVATPPAPTQSPGASFYPVASATVGLQPGDIAPELIGAVPQTDPGHTAGQLALLAASALVLLGLGLAVRFRRAGLLAVLGLVVALAALPLLLAPPPPARTVGLVDLSGHPIRLAALRGRPVWINFWATWCPPCQEETPVLESLYRANRADGLALIAISVQETSPADVAAYAQTYGLTYTIGFDATSAIFKAYQAYGLPTQIFIDRSGLVQSVYRGPVTEALGEQLLKPILASR
jgi:cytochrome c biogenesis protein CcmG/thiol:disulfide interchange protein DsbE